jgi:hypothetical protein
LGEITNQKTKNMKCGRKPTGKINIGFGITLPPDLLKRLDKKRGKIMRSRYLAKLIEEHLQTP